MSARVLFLKIEAGQIDDTRVTLALLRSEDGCVKGRVSTLALNELGHIDLMTTEGSDPPVAVARDLAARLAAFKGQCVDVVDPENLWSPDLGMLK